MKKSLLFYMCLVVLVTGLVLSGCAPKQAQSSASQSDSTSTSAASPASKEVSESAENEEVVPITIGAILEATGTGAAWGIPRVEALKIVEYQMERDGGFEVNGKKYRFVLSTGENRGKPDEAVSIAKRLLDTKNVKFFFDGGNSPASLPVCELVKDRPILAMALSTVSQSYVGKPGYDNFFNTWKPDFGKNGIAYNQAAVIKEKLPDLKTVAFFFMNDSMGKMLVPYYKEALEAQGIEVVAEEFYPTGTIDFYAQLTKIYEKKPDLLFVGNTDEEVKALLKQALQIGFKNFASCRVQPGIPTEYQDVIGDGYFFGIVDRVFTDPEAQKLPGVKEYIADYKTLFNKEPDYTIMNRAVAAYEPLYALAEAMKKAGTVDDVQKIGDALRNMTYKGKIWTIKFDEKGQMTNDYYVYYLHNKEVTKEHIVP